MDLQTLFHSPTATYRQAPFWFWNHRLDKDQLSWQINQMEQKGLGGFVMHARHGLITPYLSETWMECIRHCCQEAKKRDMIAWAYDERDWPSGPAGGAVIEDHSKRLHYLRMEEECLSGPGTLSLDEDTLAAWLVRENEAPRLLEGREIPLGEGAQTILKAVRFECPAILWFDSYLDTMNPEACQAFIKSTYDYHVEQLGNLKDLGLAGFFTDEPAFSTYPDDLNRIPWTPGLPAAFQERKGYSLMEALPALFIAGEGGAQARYDYWDVATSLFEESFFQAIGAWCESRDLQLIGHPLGEEPLLYQFRCQGNIFRHMKHQHMPGLDHLTITIGKEKPLAMNPKMVVSAALLAGRERIMTETFGESGWGLSLAQMKWMADWQMVQGVNYFIPHAFYYSIEGRRKKDSPPSEFYQAPHWPYYRYFADYTARLTAALTGGDHVAEVALLFPMDAVWASFVAGSEVPPEVQAMEEAFAPLGEMLLALHRDFVVIDEKSFAQAQVDEAGFSIQGLLFKALVLPKTTHLQESSAQKLREIAAKSPVIAVESETLQLLGGENGASLDLRQEAGVTVLKEATPESLAQALAPVLPDVMMDNADQVYYLHRQKEEKDLFFFANTGEESIETTISLRSVGEASWWNAETGESSPAAGQALVEGRLEVPLELAQNGAALLVIDPAKPVLEIPASRFHLEQKINVCDALWHFTPYDGNYLTLKRWNFRQRTRHKVTELEYSTEFSITEDLANLRLILDNVPKHPVNVPEAARPMVAHETYGEILLDGQPVTEELQWTIDQKFRVLDLSGICDAGTHRLEILLKNQGWFPQPGLEEYAWLAGDFMVDLSEGLPRLSAVRGIRAGAWENQGFPYFSGTAAYGADVTIPHLEGKRVFLNAGKVGNILDVEINGRSAGVRAWPPYRLDVTDCLWQGEENLFVLKVTNSARNLLEGPDKECASGLLEDVFLEIGHFA